MFLKIGEKICTVTGEAGSGGLLTLSFTGAVTLDEVMAALDVENAEVRIYEDAACKITSEIYRVARLTGLALNRGTNVISASLQVERIAQDEAERLQEQLDQQSEYSTDQDAALTELGGLIEELMEAVTEIGDTIAALDERVTALENPEEPTTNTEEA